METVTQSIQFRECETQAPICVNAAMDRLGMIEGHLAQAERHVAQGERHVVEQRARVEALGRDGHDTTQSLLLLGQFQELQELHVADRDRLRREWVDLNRRRWAGA